MTAWDAQNYARNFGFVPEYGRELIDLLAPEKNEKVLDLGCGTGTLTAELVARGADATGVDRDANMIELAKKTHPSIPFFQQDGENLTLSGPFNAVFSNAALHWMDIAKVFPQVARVLQRGGRFAAEMGGIHNIAAIEKAIYEALADFGLSRATTPPAWRFHAPSVCAEELERAGFEVRFLRLYDRPTLLSASAGGVKGWVRMFGQAFLESLPADKQDVFLQKVEDLTRPHLFHDGEWYADYRRQHFVGVKL